VRGTSHLSSFGVIVKIFAELWKLYPEMRRKVPRPANVSAPDRSPSS